MALSDREFLKQAQAGQIGSMPLAGDPNVPVRNAHTKYYQFLVSDAATAGTAVTETAMKIPVQGKVIGVSVTAPIAVTANDTNYATVTVAKRTAGGSASTIAAKNTKTSGSSGSGSLTAFAPYDFPAAAFTAANIQLAAGDALTLAIAKTGTGVALNAATSYFCVTVAVEEN